MRGGADIFSIMSSHFLALVSSIPSWHDGIDSGIDCIWVTHVRLGVGGSLRSLGPNRAAVETPSFVPSFSCGFLLLVHVEHVQATPFLCSSTMVKNNMKVPETVHPQMTTQSLAAHPYADGKTVKFHSTQDISTTLDDIKSFEADNIYIYFFGAYVELNTVIGASTLHHINVGVQREYALE